MAKIIIKDGEISSSAGINVPGSLTISGNVILGDNFTDTLTVNSIATFNDELVVKDILSGTTANFSTLNVATLSASNFIGLPASAGGLTPPGGTDTAIQFNKQGAFSGSTNLVFDYTNNILNGTTSKFNIYQAETGSVSVVSYGFGSSGVDTGIYRPVINQLGIATNGAEAVRFVNQISGAQIQMSSLGGIAAAPTLTWRLDNNTGIFRPTDQQIGFSTNGIERLRITNTNISASVPFTNTSINGDLTITGSNNGIVFADGTKLITAANFSANVLVIAGGGGGGGANTTTTNGGGGGGGGYMESGVTTFGEIILSTGKAYRVTVGAGGAGGTAGAQGTNGGDSYFGLNYAIGGGGGGGSAAAAGKAGGSGGGSGTTVSIGTATSRIYQTGSNGGAGDNSLTDDPAGGGGGAGGVGGSPVAIQPRGFGGSGLASTITGVSVRRAGGGGGGIDGGLTAIGSDGGGTGGVPTSGTVNTGGGGGGGGYNAAAVSGASGGSGVIIVRYPANYTATFTAGVTQSTTTSGSSKITTITAAGVNDTITFS